MFKIIRFYQDDDLDSKVIRTVHTLEEAQAWCNDPETSSRTATSSAAVERTKKYGAWFDGYEEIREH